jgi:hypothetical protein
VALESFYRGVAAGEELGQFGITITFETDGDLKIAPAAGRTVDIGGAATKKVSFHGGTGSVQGAAIAAIDSSTVDGTYGAEEQAVLGDLRTKFNTLLTFLRLRGDIAT